MPAVTLPREAAAGTAGSVVRRAPFSARATRGLRVHAHRVERQDVPISGADSH